MLARLGVWSQKDHQLFCGNLAALKQWPNRGRRPHSHKPAPSPPDELCRLIRELAYRCGIRELRVKYIQEDGLRKNHKTYYWILAETGVRAGEIGALPVRNVLLDLGAIRITQSVWHGTIQTVKSLKGNRLCEISPQLIEHLRQYIRRWRPNQLGLMFASKNGTPWDTDTVRKRKLYPLLDKLDILQCGFHAFRHGNETVMDQESVPMAVRQARLGHSDARTTMRYSHVVSEDGRQFAARLGELLAPQTMPSCRQATLRILVPNGARFSGERLGSG